jgi:aminoglycoside phosphotransferase (APT) family kinase protein
MADAKLTLPDDVLAWIEEVTGRTVVAADRIPAGATREGWFIDVAAGSGAPGPEELFLRFSPVAMPERSAFHHLATEAAVMQALAGTGAAVPTIIAVHPSREAVLSRRMPGATWFYRISDPAEQLEVARDFVRNLATVHRLDPDHLGLEALGPVRTAREHALERIEDIRRRGTAPDGSMDPLLRLSTDWLERNVPDYEGPVVLVQGDTGPGNFLYEGSRVTAVVDWELSHWGDPMDDIAWLSLRTVQDTFTHLPDRLAEYSQMSGHPVDERRVWYYRLFAESTMATLYPNNGRDSRRPGEEDDNGVARDIGNGIIYRQLHRRLWLEALAAVMGLDLEPPSLPAPVDLPEWHQFYAVVLGSLRTIVPRISDPLASQWTKGVARVVKYLQDLDASGREFAELERDDIASLLGRRPEHLQEGRDDLAQAARAGKVSDEDYVRYMWRKVLRDDHLMRHASGALHERTWPPLV